MLCEWQVVDGIFFIDMCMNFFMAYQEFDIQGPHWVGAGRFYVVGSAAVTYDSGHFSGVRLEEDHPPLPAHLVVPRLHLYRALHVRFDLRNSSSSATLQPPQWILGRYILQATGVEEIMAADGSADALFYLRLVRMIKLLRLIKMIRILRASRIFTRFESRMTITYGKLAIIRNFGVLLLAAHLLACTWTLQTEFAVAGEATWINCNEPEIQATLPDGFSGCGMGGGAPLWTSRNDYVGLYFASLYWAIMTITSIGYGDMHAVSVLEQAVSCFVMLMGAIIWAAIIASFCAVLSQLDPSGVEFRKTIDHLNAFIQRNHLKKDVAIRLREYEASSVSACDTANQPSDWTSRRYFFQTRYLQRDKMDRVLLSKMSPALQGEVTLALNESWLKKVWFFKDCDNDFLVQV